MSISAGLAAFELDPDAELDELVEAVIEGDIESILDIDIGRTWHALATLLSAGDGPVEPDVVSDPLNPVLGGTIVGEDVGAGASHVYTPAEVVAVAARLDATSNGAVVSTIDAARFDATDVYPGGWSDGAGATVRELEPALDALRSFYHRAAEQSLAVVVELY